LTGAAPGADDRSAMQKVQLASIMALVVVAGCGGGDSDAPGNPSTVAATATSQETPTPLGQGREELEAGIHVVDLVARAQPGTGPPHLPKIEITLPEGWFNYDGWSVGKGQKLPQTVVVTFWDVAQVYPTPCDWKGKPMVNPGADADGLASALAGQPLRSATAPTDGELGGFRGKYLELSVPTDIDFDDCNVGYFESWTGNGWSSDRYQQSPGQVDRIWILDVDGQRLLVDASYLPEATPQDRAELESVVDSIRVLD
jgi:hypothetical protein